MCLQFAQGSTPRVQVCSVHNTWLRVVADATAHGRFLTSLGLPIAQGLALQLLRHLLPHRDPAKHSSAVASFCRHGIAVPTPNATAMPSPTLSPAPNCTPERSHRGTSPLASPFRSPLAAPAVAAGSGARAAVVGRHPQNAGVVVEHLCRVLASAWWPRLACTDHPQQAWGGGGAAGLAHTATVHDVVTGLAASVCHAHQRSNAGSSMSGTCGCEAMHTGDGSHESATDVRALLPCVSGASLTPHVLVGLCLRPSCLPWRLPQARQPPWLRRDTGVCGIQLHCLPPWQRVAQRAPRARTHMHHHVTWASGRAW